MNQLIKTVLLIAIPSAVSATISHFVTKKIISTKYEAEMEARINKEIKDFKKEYAERMESEPKRIPQSQLTPEQRKRLYTDMANKVNHGKEEIVMPENNKDNYKEMEEPAPMEDDINDEDEDEDLYDEDGNMIGDPNIEDGDGEDVVSEEDENSKPYVISQQEFDSDDGYSKSSLVYYEDDKVLANENDYILNIEEIIGLDSLEHFGDMSGDPTIVYIRNLSLNSDYEVQLVHGSYKHLVGDLK